MAETLILKDMKREKDGIGLSRIQLRKAEWGLSSLGYTRTDGMSRIDLGQM
jgi:hypothetical protein